MADPANGPSGCGGRGGGLNGDEHRHPSVKSSQSKRPKPAFMDEDDLMTLPPSGSGLQNRNASPSSSSSRWTSQESLGSTDNNFCSPVQSRSATPIGVSDRATPGLSNLLRSADINSMRLEKMEDTGAPVFKVKQDPNMQMIELSEGPAVDKTGEKVQRCTKCRRPKKGHALPVGKNCKYVPN